MTTVSQTVPRYGEGHQDALGVTREVLLFFAAPFIGLVFVATYALFGLAAALCFGLKAFGIKCGVFKN